MKIMSNYLKPFLLLTISLFLIIFSQSFISSDVISLNSGGSTNLSLTPDKYIEGFFFGIEEAALPVCGNGVIESGEQCDDGNTVSGDGCSSTCQTEAVIPPNGGDRGVIVPLINILVQPTKFNINIEINTNVERTVRVTNLESSSVTVGVSQQGLNNMIILGNNSLTIPAGATVEMKVIFVAPSGPGIYTGRIIIDGVQILVSLNVKTKFLLFDSNIVVLNENYTVIQGDQLRTLVTLIPLGDPQRLDVTLNFIIKDYANRVYLTKTETLLVENQTDLRRNFDTGILPIGDYVIGLELVYLDRVAPSSAHFRVTEKAIPFILGRIVLFLIIMILIVLIIIIIILIIRKRKQKKQSEIVEEQEFQ